MPRAKDNRVVITDLIYDLLHKVAVWSGGDNTITVERVTDQNIAVIIDNQTVMIKVSRLAEK